MLKVNDKSARYVLVIVIEMDTAVRVQIPDETVVISHKANSFGKNMNPTILSLAMSKK